MLRVATTNNRPLMLLASAVLAWCLLLCPSLTLAMQTTLPAGSDEPAQVDPTQVEPVSGGCHSAPAETSATTGDHDGCDNCQATDQIPGGLLISDTAPAAPLFNLPRITSQLSALLTAAPSLPPDTPPLFLLEQVFLI